MSKTLYELSELLRSNGGPIPMSRAGIYLAVKNNQIKSVRIGRRIFIPSYIIDEMLQPPSKDPKPAGD